MRINGLVGRFFLVGVSAALLYFWLMWFFLEHGLRPALATVVAFSLVFVLAYMVQRNWTFSSTARHEVLLPRYLAVQLLCMLFSAVLAELAHRILWGGNTLIVAAVATLASGGLSYLLSSRWVFSGR